MKKKYLAVLIIIINLIILSQAFADETSTFTSKKPDVLLILDGSGSMVYEPTGNDCKNNSSTGFDCGNKVYGNSNCDNYTDSGFYTYSSSDSNRNTDCRKIAIAQRAIGKILDKEEIEQKVRMGFMGYANCSNNSPESQGSATTPKSTGGYNPNSGQGCNYVRNQIDDYYNSSTDNAFEDIRTTVNNNFTPVGGTPLVGALAEASAYFTNYTDNAKDCRSKFALIITDGDDTYACSGGDGHDYQEDQYKRRRESVAAAKALYDTFASSTDPNLADEKIKLFVIGFGSGMPYWSINTLNWMAYYGQTSFSSTHTGDVNSYKLDTMTSTDLYPLDPATNQKITACQDQPTYLETDRSYYQNNPAYNDYHNYCDGNTGHAGCVLNPSYSRGGHNYNEQLTDPGTNTLTGYALMAQNATEMDKAQASAFKVIADSYSFATSSVQSVRTKDENYVYEASFTVRSDDPFYIGHLKQYQINTDGTIPTNFKWDAGALMQTASASSRNIWTYKSGAPIAFSGDGSTSGNINYTDLGVTGATAAADAGKIITFIRGGDITDTTDPNNQWKLGDTFHSFPVTLGTPATYFCDNVDSTTGACCNNVSCQDPFTCNPVGSCCTCQKAFDIYRGQHQRTTVNENRMIVTGANDGQFHMFSTYDGVEEWSFIPPNLLSQLQYISHQAHPDLTQSHTYFVDGPISISDIWLPASTYTIGVAKTYSDWYTWLVLSEGRGAKNTLWSSSPSCDKNLSQYYSVGSNTYPYYCGYYAFDATNVTRSNPAPTFKWLLGISSADAPYLGEPWSKMIMSRVRIDGNEKWVGFIGGGNSDCLSTDNSSCATRGLGFFVVDLKTGSVLKRFSNATNLNMTYQLVSPPAAVDTDNDGFADTVYVGDLGNNIWRFKMCLQADGTCGMSTTGKWITTALLSSSTHNRKIFTQASVTRDNAGNMWVYVGTGDKKNPTATGNSYKDRLYAIIDNDLSSTWNSTNLFNATSTNFDPTTIFNPSTNTGYHGWYIDLSIGDGEKILADPVVFQGVVYFTTYVPPSGTDVCNQSGKAYLYAVDYVTGMGKFSGNNRYEFIGYGIPSSPLVSVNPYGGTDIYVSTSQKNTQTADTFVKKESTPNIINYNKTNLMMWRDKRVQ
jgi:Tfp pilus tip-associated adhesin PilY1